MENDPVVNVLVNWKTWDPSADIVLVEIPVPEATAAEHLDAPALEVRPVGHAVQSELLLALVTFA